MRRRGVLKGAALLAALGPAAGFAQAFGNQESSSPIPPRDRLEQGPFDIDQDEGWLTALFTTPSEKPLRNPGLGLVGYSWEESGPSLAARAGRETLEQHVENISSLPFVDVLYIRCDWRNVQSRPGRLDLDPVWKLTLDAAKSRGLRVAFRVQLSSPVFQPEQIALPEFLRSRIPMVKIGRIPGHENSEYVEPRYDHPEFQKAFGELNHLLAAEFDGNPLIEWVDMMQYGFWGEGHTSNFPNPFPDDVVAEGSERLPGVVYWRSLGCDPWRSNRPAESCGRSAHSKQRQLQRSGVRESGKELSVQRREPGGGRSYRPATAMGDGGRFPDRQCPDSRSGRADVRQPE